MRLPWSSHVAWRTVISYPGDREFELHIPDDFLVVAVLVLDDEEFSRHRQHTAVGAVEIYVELTVRVRRDARDFRIGLRLLFVQIAGRPHIVSQEVIHPSLLRE